MVTRGGKPLQSRGLHVHSIRRTRENISDGDLALGLDLRMLDGLGKSALLIPRGQILTIFRVHIYQRHTFICQRCQLAFKDNEGLKVHLAEELCISSAPGNVIEHCNEKQEKRLRSRKKNKKMTDVEEWNEIYRVLFGTDCDIPCGLIKSMSLFLKSHSY